MKKTVAIIVFAAFCSAAFCGGAKQHKVVDGDTLWDLSGKFYGNPEQWNRIYDANKDAIKDPHWIYPQMELVIPEVMIKAEEIVAESTAPMHEDGVPGAAPGSAVVPVVYASTAAPAASAPGKSPEQDKIRMAAPRTERQLLTSGPDGETRLFSVSIRAPEYDVSEKMPRDMTWGFPSADTKVVPIEWREDGYVEFASLTDEEDDLAGLGDAIVLKITSKVALKKGEFIYVYRRGTQVESASGEHVGLELEKSAIVRVTKIDGKRVEGELVRVTNPVEKGDIVKKI